MDPEQNQTDRADTEQPTVPYGTAIDQRPAVKRSRAATNDASDRSRAFLLIAGILGVVLLAVILGHTVLRPWILAVRERTAIRITQEQAELLGELARSRYRATGVIIDSYEQVREEKILETFKGRDLWGNGFRLLHEWDEAGRVVFRVLSAGPDGEFETDDDIEAVIVFESDSE